jgi:hypothetical protein
LYFTRSKLRAYYAPKNLEVRLFDGDIVLVKRMLLMMGAVDRSYSFLAGLEYPTDKKDRRLP